MIYILIGLMLLIFLLITILILQETSHKKERIDLYNRIMAKDLPEYKDIINKTPVKKISNPMKNKYDKTYEGGNNT
jgi:hypothetical protein